MTYRGQKYAACKLITAINARIYLGGVDVTNEEFEMLVDLAKCRYGAALNVEACYPKLGLVYEDGPLDTMPLQWVREKLPVEIGYSDPKFGFHSALITDVIENEVVLINANWTQVRWSEIYFFPHEYNRTLRTFKWKL
jgi:hypothetical protein